MRGMPRQIFCRAGLELLDLSSLPVSAFQAARTTVIFQLIWFVAIVLEVWTVKRQFFYVIYVSTIVQGTYSDLVYYVNQHCVSKCETQQHVITPHILQAGAYRKTTDRLYTVQTPNHSKCCRFEGANKGHQNIFLLFQLQQIHMHPSVAYSKETNVYHNPHCITEEKERRELVETISFQF